MALKRKYVAQKIKEDKKKRDRRKTVAKRGKKSIKVLNKEGTGEMLLESFGEQLTIIRGFGIIDPERLGRDMALSFVVETKTGLLLSDQSHVEIPHVGTLRRNEEKVSFEAAGLLKEDAAATKRNLLLEGFLNEQQTGTADFWRRVFEKPSDLPPDFEESLPGQDLLARLGSQLIGSHMSADPKLSDISLDTLVEGMSLLVHDAICCGAGIELETLGTFHPDFSFTPDDILLTTIKHKRALTNPHIKTSSLKVTRL